MNYVTVDAYRIGEFPYWFHQTWTTIFQLIIALVILYNSVGLATISAMIVIILTVACNAPLAKLQHKFQTKLMEAQDIRLKAVSEALVNVKVLKLYAWETHFKKIIEGLREIELKWLSAFQFRRAYNIFLFWSSPVLVSAATFTTCYFLHIPLNPSNVFTFVATLRLVQDPVRQIPEVIGTVIQANVAFARIVKFLHAPELNIKHVRKHTHLNVNCPVVIEGGSFSWEESTLKPTLRNINLVVKAKEKVAICGEVGSGKSSLLAAILGEIPKTEGKVVVSAVLYLKLKKAQGNVEDRSSLAMRILECNKQKMSKLEAKASTRLLLKTFKDLEALIFMKPLHIRVKLQCADHPTAVTNKETILIDSSINVDISLD